MCCLDLFADYSLTTIFALAVLAFTAGFIDAVVGGGGLIQIPALLINLPNTPVATIFGTNKVAAITGTSVAAYQFSKKVNFNFKLLIIVSFFSFVSSFLGAMIVSIINSEILKPIILFVLVIILVYTYLKKDLGTGSKKELSFKKQVIYGSLIGGIVGFYDGFFGPGGGSFYLLGFVVLLGFDFVRASAYAKIINCVTNVGALLVFLKQGNYLMQIGIVMAFCNIAGSLMGSKMALNQGNKFIRVIFLIVVILMILRYAYDIFIT
ncbi:TSUP family transporter [Marinifilum caeruleilacunae]|uniref:Probable membrane transporter protein n=1 Tax=Marinifilum caeruleilacunae TaxID=2499076 RepID=A0ABX1WU93_9BACT|nr:TSUP family transporter [Marinifilum caeruleilacunae]NOU59681.1 sulfite exporter TauE/SafE family protein [Marinifilum caeruleilacunae]